MTAAEPLQLLPPPPPLATMVSATVMELPGAGSLCRSAPNGAPLPEIVDQVMVAVPKFWMAPPPLVPAVLPLNVLSVIVAAAPVLWLKIPPPSWPELPVNVLNDTLSDPLLLIAPPEVPVADGAELPLNVVRVTDSAPRAKTAPPPCAPLSARPSLSVRPLSDRLPCGWTSNRRKAALPDRVIVAPSPAMLTDPVMAGRPLGPSVVLSAFVSE